MAVPLKTLEEILKKLPSTSQAEVIHFAEFLSRKRQPKAARKLRQTWADALSEYRDQYTSVELQKKALDWRGD